MFKNRILSLLSILMALQMAWMFTSCTPTEETETDPKPTISIDPDAATLEVGQSVTVTYTVVANAKISEIRIIRDAVGTIQVVNSGFTNPESHTGSFAITAAAADAGKTINYTFEVVDKDGATNSKQFVLTVNAGGPDPIAVSSYTETLGAQNASAGSSIDLEGGAGARVYKINDATSNSAKIDLVYFFTDIQKGVLSAPNDASLPLVLTQVSSWSTKNATGIKNTTLTAAQFDAITDGNDVIAAYNGGTATTDGTRAKFLAGGEVIAVKTVGGVYALVKVSSITGTQDGSASIAVKINQ